MGYCTVDQVCDGFPSFQRSQPGSISDDQIQSWIDQSSARIRGALMSRGIDPVTLTLTTDQTNWLAGICEDCVAAKLVAALESMNTSQSAEDATAGQRRRVCESILQEIRDGLYDAFFNADAAIIDTDPGFAGIGGAETEVGETAADRGENRSFSKADVY